MTLSRTYEIQMAFRTALAAALAYWVATLFDTGFPIYALIAAVFVTHLSRQETRRMAGPRLAGIVVGAVIGASSTYIGPVGPIPVGVAIIVAMLVMSALNMQAAAKIAGFTAAIVMFMPEGDPWQFAVLRAFESVLGIAAAVLVSYMPKLLHEQVSATG